MRASPDQLVFDGDHHALLSPRSNVSCCPRGAKHGDLLRRILLQKEIRTQLHHHCDFSLVSCVALVRASLWFVRRSGSCVRNNIDWRRPRAMGGA